MSDSRASRPTGSLPDDPRLAQIAEALTKTRGAAALCDGDWRLVWISDELKRLLDEWDEGKLGYGKHIIEAYTSDTWGCKVTEESQLNHFFEAFPLLIWDTPGGKRGVADALKRASREWEETPSWFEGEITDELIDQVIEQMEPVEPPPFWTGTFEFLQGDLPPLKVVEVDVRILDKKGEFVGTAIVFEPGLSAAVMTLVARGDEQMFERMTHLVEPRRRQAAVMFADLQDSAVLSRRLPSAAYFKLICQITTAVDEVVGKHTGIVGKHAGDGVTAFFLSDDLGSPSEAARAAISAARDVIIAGRDAAKSVSEETGLIDPDDCQMNVGVHWGGTLYMGQLVTGGRLEVTALGDQVNEGARIQESARDGAILASKALIEHLTDDDAAGLGLEPGGVLYRTVADLPGASEKAKRDAGGIPVTNL